MAKAKAKKAIKRLATKKARAPAPPAPAALNAELAAAATKIAATPFFNGDDTPLHDLLAPAVYRAAASSHTTILVYVGRTRVRHIPMDAGALVVVTTELKRFRDEWRRTQYPVMTAAEKYLHNARRMLGIERVASERARYVLEAVAGGIDAAPIKAALDRPLSDASPSSLANGLAAAAKQPLTAKKKKGATLPKGRGIGAWVCAQLVAKISDAKILAEVTKKFPGAKTNAAHLTWYRNKLRRANQL